MPEGKLSKAQFYSHLVSVTASPTRLCFFGASPTTGNLGVSALHDSVIGMVARWCPHADLSVFDYGRGERFTHHEFDKGALRVRQMAAHPSRRIWRRDSLLNMRASQWFLGARSESINPGLALVRQSDAVMDISGGDSFTDIYGRRRFWDVCLPKLIALESHRPLILLPQTYGPFQSNRLRRVAERIVRGSSLAWARDARSFQSLQKLLGSDFDPERHKLGVDVAFGLEPHPPDELLPTEIGTWLQESQHPIVGVNISGLLYHSPRRQAELGFKLDYGKLMLELTQRLLSQGNVRVLLLPHVLSPHGHYESDPQACEAIAQQLVPQDPDQLRVVPACLNASQTKGLVSKLDWLVGARMHATIAALSSGVPAAAVAYSPKFLGVFERCNQSASVADPTSLDHTAAIGLLWRAFQDRSKARHQLQDSLVSIHATLAEQGNLIFKLIPA